jgi:hypothetical protein
LPPSLALVPVFAALLFGSFAWTFLKGVALDLLAQGTMVLDSFSSSKDSVWKIESSRLSIKRFTKESLAKFRAASKGDRE